MKKIEKIFAIGSVIVVSFFCGMLFQRDNKAWIPDNSKIIEKQRYDCVQIGRIETCQVTTLFNTDNIGRDIICN